MIKTICHCGKPVRHAGPRAGYDQRDCLDCHAESMRVWRKTHPLEGLARLKMNARAYLHTYIKRGKVQRGPCEVCGGKAEAHHTDYSKPLDVRWLCRDHHPDEHPTNNLTQ